MAPRTDAATLNVQPRQRRIVYAALAASPDGHSVKELLELDDLDVPEVELRETLRKLDAAGLAKRIKGSWTAIPLDDAPAPAPAPEPEAEAEAESDS